MSSAQIWLKTPNGLVPGNEEAQKAFSRIKFGDEAKGKIGLMRNPKFHRKFFSLLKYAYDHWEPPPDRDRANTAKYGPARKSFDTFREEITIRAGYYETHAKINGQIKLQAKSISFAKMGQDEFEQLYSDVLDVLMQLVFTEDKGWTREDVEEYQNKILGYV